MGEGAGQRSLLPRREWATSKEVCMNTWAVSGDFGGSSPGGASKRPTRAEEAGGPEHKRPGRARRGAEDAPNDPNEARPCDRAPPRLFWGGRFGRHAFGQHSTFFRMPWANCWVARTAASTGRSPSRALTPGSVRPPLRREPQRAPGPMLSVFVRLLFGRGRQRRQHLRGAVVSPETLFVGHVRAILHMPGKMPELAA